MKTAIVCAWRKGETDLEATLDSAKRAAPDQATIYAVEDKDASGPGRTRHRGIMAADEADVIVIIDAHMRFRGKALGTLAREACMDGSLVCAVTHHNEVCDFSGNPYYGARIVYKAKNGREHKALEGKWSRSTTCGPVGCIMGACYAFRRDWYMEAGQPLAMLAGWGCDEEALSIAAWLCGRKVECNPVVAAHRYRPRPPWGVRPKEFTAVRMSRMALISAFAQGNDRFELENWTRINVPEGVRAIESEEIDRVRAAMAKQARTWAEWRAEVCEPDEIDGKQERKEDQDMKKKRKMQEVNKVVLMPGVRCVHCAHVHDPKALRVTHTYPNGNRRHLCESCGRPFITRFAA